MAKLTDRTKIFLNGEEISQYTVKARPNLEAGMIETVDLTLYVEKWEVDEKTGGLIIHVGRPTYPWTRSGD